MMDELIKAINKYPNGTEMIVEWNNKLKIKGKIDTIYETDNGLDMDDKNYKEFFSCLFNISSVLYTTTTPNAASVGSLMDITIQNPPTKILLENGNTVWQIYKMSS